MARCPRHRWIGPTRASTDRKARASAASGFVPSRIACAIPDFARAPALRARSLQATGPCRWRIARGAPLLSAWPYPPSAEQPDTMDRPGPTKRIAKVWTVSDRNGREAGGGVGLPPPAESAAKGGAAGRGNRPVGTGDLHMGWRAGVRGCAGDESWSASDELRGASLGPARSRIPPKPQYRRKLVRSRTLCGRTQRAKPSSRDQGRIRT